jgi:WD40 repeat protein
MSELKVQYKFEDPSNLEVKAVFGTHHDPVHHIQFSPDGGYMASGDDRGILIVGVSELTSHSPSIIIGGHVR